jgi:hypothetical protein
MKESTVVKTRQTHLWIATHWLHSEFFLLLFPSQVKEERRKIILIYFFIYLLTFLEEIFFIFIIYKEESLAPKCLQNPAKYKCHLSFLIGKSLTFYFQIKLSYSPFPMISSLSFCTSLWRILWTLIYEISLLLKWSVMMIPILSQHGVLDVAYNMVVTK